MCAFFYVLSPPEQTEQGRERAGLHTPQSAMRTRAAFPGIAGKLPGCPPDAYLRVSFLLSLLLLLRSHWRLCPPSFQRRPPPPLVKKVV